MCAAAATCSFMKVRATLSCPRTASAPAAWTAADREFLEAHKLELVVLQWFQRLELSERHGDKHPQVQSSVEARLGSDLAVHESKPRREEHDLALHVRHDPADSQVSAARHPQAQAVTRIGLTLYARRLPTWSSGGAASRRPEIPGQSLLRAPSVPVRASPGTPPRTHGHLADGGGPKLRLRQRPPWSSASASAGSDGL